MAIWGDFQGFHLVINMQCSFMGFAYEEFYHCIVGNKTWVLRLFEYFEGVIKRVKFRRESDEFG